MHEMEKAEASIQQICVDVAANYENIKSEEDAKFQIINRILVETLGWKQSDVCAEMHHQNGFSDYILKENGRPVFLLEAKRIGVFSIDAAEKAKVKHLRLSSSALKTASAGIDQAASYATPNGLPLAVLTDGLTWIVFKTFVVGENFKTKEAVIFPSLEAVRVNFSIFYDLLSKKQFGNRVYNSYFDAIHQKRLLLTQELNAPIEQHEIKLSQKSEIAFDLDKVFSNFFSRLTGDDDEDLLINCFVESSESRIADFALEKMTADVLGNINRSSRGVDSELTNLISSSVQNEEYSVDSGDTIFIIGPTGAGKSTFLDRFFRKTLPLSIRRQCLVVSINCLDASGREDTALHWITEQVISAIEQQLYDNGAPKWLDLLGLYHLEYKKRAEGVDAQLYQRDPQQFKENFGVFLDNKVQTDREGYLRKLISDVVINRKMLPIFLIDNTDEFPMEFKQRIFQFAQSLRRHAKHCLVIFPITDKTAWSFSKTDIFGIYRSKSFFLPTPSPREVFRKRIEFLKGKVTDGDTKEKRKKYLLSKGISISIEDLSGFAKVLESVFVDQDYTSKTIGELTNYNIRRTLLLSQRVITSSVIKIEDLIKSFVVHEPVTSTFTAFMEALMKGDYELYNKVDAHEIYPVFQVDKSIKQSPLLKLRILSLLEAANKGSRSVDERHLTVQSIIEYFDAIGATESSVTNALISLLDGGLVEPYDTSSKELSDNQRLAISHRGIVHLRLASFNSTFFDQMAVTTAIIDADVALKIRTEYKSSISPQLKFSYIRGLFLKYLISEDAQHMSISVELEQYECQRDLISNLKRFSDKNSESASELIATLGEDYKEGIVKQGVVASIDWFDREKGFGFAVLPDIDSRIYLNVDKLYEIKVESVSDGDDVLCDVARGPRGFYIDKIYDIEKDVHKVEFVECSIIRVFHDRGYGFVSVDGSAKTAFFHFSVFLTEDRPKLSEGQSIKAEIGPDRTGAGFQVKQVLQTSEQELKVA